MNNLTETNHRVLAIVPARSGSKSIPGKNTKLFNGHPLIAYSIVAGHRAKSVNRVIVSTDDPNIAAVARDYDAEVPFLRPTELGRDDTPDLPVFEHALRWLDRHEGYRPDIIVQLRPTSPLRPVKCVDEAVSLLFNNPLADSVRGVIPSGQNPYKIWRIEEKFLVPIIQSGIYEPYNILRQKLPATFWQTGHIDVIRYETIVKKHSMVGEHIMPLIIDSTYATDLDTLEDWEFAEWILSHRNLDIARPGNVPSFLSDIRMVVLDFDGVFTDNRVYIIDGGKEAVACDRSDGMGLTKLKEYRVKVVVLSSETNPVVSSRCRKLNLPCYQGIKDKKSFFETLISEQGFTTQQVVYVGNDVNDLECMRLARSAVAVPNAHPEVLKIANLILSKPGGQGAIRELCDLIISAKNYAREKDG